MNTGSNPTVKVFVFIDALGWKQVEKYGFLTDLLPYRRSVEMQFGYSCTAIPTILTGVRPAEHGHLAFYDYAPAKSPFKAMRWLAPLLRPRDFWRRGRIRNLLSKLIKRAYGFTGYFQLYGVPIERLPQLDYCEKNNLFVKGGLAPIPNLADVWETQGMRYHISDWHLPETENFRIAADHFRHGSVDRAFVYSAAFDALQHDNVGQDEVLRQKVEKYAESIRDLYQALDIGQRPFELTVFSDHGMTPLRGTIDAPTAIAQTGLKWGEDYASAIDSTMARFWWLKPDSETKIREAFKQFPGHWLTESEMKYHGIWREDHKFGDAIFLADAGVQFCPSDMGVKPLNGMHGFAPDDEDSLACWLSTVPVPKCVSRVCDYFQVMTGCGTAS
ncbi:MAG: alkaline phosphatase family protein [Kiritimatiellae bacterium]|nr:alkaline phosphatase family protein [Kiritimatiellia bacterium]